MWLNLHRSEEDCIFSNIGDLLCICSGLSPRVSRNADRNALHDMTLHCFTRDHLLTAGELVAAFSFMASFSSFFFSVSACLSFSSRDLLNILTNTASICVTANTKQTQIQENYQKILTESKIIMTCNSHKRTERLGWIKTTSNRDDKQEKAEMNKQTLLKGTSSRILSKVLTQ